MREIFLNIGCGYQKLDGFLNVDILPSADLQHDVTLGLPFPDSSVSGVYCEHFIEHLSQADGVSFLRECRRVLVPGGIVRVATPDLDAIVAQYAHWEWRQPWMETYGYQWLDNRAESLNIQLRDWGHQWLYNEEELSRLGRFVGLNAPIRCRLNESQIPMFANRETRPESLLVVEFRKHIEPLGDFPLVSIVMPVYKAAYFKESLESALNQSYGKTEILVLDDSSNDDILRIIDGLSAGDRVRFVRNRPRLGEIASLSRGIREARGSLIKPLYDDDRLAPRCVERLVEAFRTCPEAALATSHRGVIDTNGESLGEQTYAQPLVDADSQVEGVSLASFILQKRINFIGEPSVVMFRRRDALAIGPLVMSFAGKSIIGVGDVALYLNLLSRGNLIYLRETLGFFRVHEAQSQKEELTRQQGTANWTFLYQHATRLGLVKASSVLVHRSLDVNDHSHLVSRRKADIAVILHLFHVDLWNDLRDALHGIGEAFDLFVSIHKSDFKTLSELVRRDFATANVFAFDNKGRDILPFLYILKILRPLGYRLILKLHTKKSPHLREEESRRWRQMTLMSLAHSEKRVRDILNDFDENAKLGLFAPSGFLFYTSCQDSNWTRFKELGLRMGVCITDQDEVHFPAGSMFWARPEALDPLLKLGLDDRDFEEEAGQLDGTLAHVVERLFGLSTHASGFQMLDRCRNIDNFVYQSWWERHRPDSADLAIRLRSVDSWEYRPVIHLVVSFSEGEERALANTLDSLGAQYYEHWRLSVVSRLPSPDPLFDEMPELLWHTYDPSLTRHAAAVGQVVTAVKSDWVGFLASGDRLESHALLSSAEAARVHPHWRLLYGDEDRIGPDGSFHSPRFKPEFNLDLLRSTDYLSGLVLLHAKLLAEIDVTDEGLVFDSYDLSLRCFEVFGATSLGHLPDVLIHRPEAVDIVSTDRQAEANEIVSGHLARCGISAEVRDGMVPATRIVTYPLSSTPLVSIIIPTKDRLDLLRPCVESVLEKTHYPAFEVLIVDNQSGEPETLEYLSELTGRDQRIRVLPYPHDYNFAAINNRAAQQANGDFLLFLNNDTVILQEFWLEEMVRQGLRDEVGAVGARLVYADGTIQHAGVILGMGTFGVAEHWHLGHKLDAPGYMNRLQVAQNLSAVTAACLLMRKSLFQTLGGFDAERLKVLYNDVDLCLRVGQTGHLIVWTPRATVLHHGSSSLSKEQSTESRQRSMDEVRTMLRNWLPKLGRDPAYSPHLSLKEQTPALEMVADVPWLRKEPERLHLVGMPLDSFGIGEYRMRAPLRQLQAFGYIKSKLMPEHCGPGVPTVMNLTEVARAEPDVIFLQENFTQFLDIWNTYRDYTDAFLVYSQDDLVFQLPARHPSARCQGVKDYKKQLRKMLGLTHRLIVGTAPMAEALQGMIDDIRVVPNRLEWMQWGQLTSPRRSGAKPRVGWAGGIQHAGDLALLVPVVKATAKVVDWIFMGLCPDSIRPLVAEFHPGVPFDQYPERLASLALDLAVAPLERNNFNIAKSNLRLLEFGVLGWPVICTDIFPYQQGNPPVCRLPNQPEAWVKAIRERIADLDALAKEGDALQAWVLENWILEQHLDEWLSALTPPGRRLSAIQRH